MSIQILHAFQSGKADGADATLIQPSNWNEAHTITMATARVLGRVTAGTGDVEELTADNIWNLLNFQGTGDANPTRMLFHMTTPPTGWTKDTTHNNKALRLVSGTIGTGGSMDFTTAFGSRVIATGNLPDINLSSANLTITGQPNLSGSQSGQLTRNFARTNDNVQPQGGGVTVVKSVTWADTTLSVDRGDLDVGGSIPLGGSGTPISFAVNYVDVVIAERA